MPARRAKSNFDVPVVGRQLGPAAPGKSADGAAKSMFRPGAALNCSFFRILYLSPQMDGFILDQDVNAAAQDTRAY
jgi:hypothetical protein